MTGSILTATNTIGTLIVFDLILLAVLTTTALGLRNALAAVPGRAALLAQQLQAALRDTESLDSANARSDQTLAELEARIGERGGLLETSRQQLQAAKDRVPVTIYVLDQIIQDAHLPWLIMVRRGEAGHAPPGTLLAEWAAGRRFIVYSETAANARRRIEGRFAAAQGYRLGEPESFSLA